MFLLHELLSAFRDIRERARYRRRVASLPDARPLSDSSDAWYMASPALWAYAGGGRLHVYGNSKEAIEESIRLGFKVLEIDVALTADCVPVCSHWFRPNNEVMFDQRPTAAEFKSRLLNGRFTPLTLQELLDRYGDYGGWISLDPWSIYAEGFAFDFADFLVKHTTSELRKRIIYQVPDVETACRVKECGFCSVHMSFPNDVIGGLKKWKLPFVLRELTASGVKSVSIADRPIDNWVCEVVPKIRAVGIHVSVAGVEDLSRVRKWMSVGADCFNTRYLSPDVLGDL